MWIRKGNPVPLRNPITGALYANGVVPQSDWTPLATLVINALPAPNIPNSFSNNYASLPKASLIDNKGDGRIDYILNDKTTMFGRFSNHHGDIVDASSIPGAGWWRRQRHHPRLQQAVGGRDHALRSRRTRFSMPGSDSPGPMAEKRHTFGQQSLNTQAGIPGLPTDKSVIRALSSENSHRLYAFGAQGSNPQFQNPFVIDPKLNYSILKGRNSIKLGWEMLAINTEIDDFNPVYGQENFAGGFSQNGGGYKRYRRARGNVPDRFPDRRAFHLSAE